MALDIIVLLVLTTFNSTAGMTSAQEPRAALAELKPPPEGVTQELVLRDGTRAYGRVEHVVENVLVFRTVSGAAIEVATPDVVALRQVVGEVRHGEFWRADANPTRLFFAPTGRALRRGEGYFGVYEIVLPFIQVGITDRLSFGAGTPLILGAGSAHPFWITPKLQVLSAANVDASVGVMHFLNVPDGSLGIAYGVATYGSADTALTTGLGYGYERGGRGGGAAVGMVGAEHRVSRGVKVITENYVWSGGGLAMGGVRWIGERLSADLGMLMPLGEDETFVFPMINFVWTFSRD